MEDHKCEVILLETSDLHGVVLPRSYADGSEIGYGLARIAAIVREIRQNDPYTLLIDNGDCLQGTPMTYYHAKVDNTAPNPVIACMNALGYDAAVLGNHEFNYGLPYLRSAVGASAFPWLSANTIDAVTGVPLFGKPYMIREMPNGLRIGVLGLTTAHIPNWEQPQHIEGVRFGDVVEAARQWVNRLRQEERVDVVILSYHGGLERDPMTGEPTEPLTGENVGYRICEQVSGIDVLLTGHQHRAIADCEINGVCVVQPANEGRFLAKVTLQLAKGEGGWSVKGSRSELISAMNYRPDEEITRCVEEVEAATQAWLDQPVGLVEGDMTITSHADARLHEHPLIEFIHRVQMEVSGADISATALFDDQSKGFSQCVTMRDILSHYVYPNTLKVLRISGGDLRAALEKSAEYFDLDAGGEIVVNPSFLTPKPQHYNYDMWEGIHYTLDISQPVGRRVTKLEQNGQSLDQNELFEVVMNNYRAGGGGNFTMFQHKLVVKDIPTDMIELLADYIRNGGRLVATANRNWSIVNGERNK
ncbi:2',3'-cyclic-nucleotide 2'-phosphodiesterase / 3'-nucleotidase [Paenibacillus sp. UNC496MF]|uniref:bifunctional metallophosphatase/5'-nucleotidase n=1 Tax=Paenibacillus sp. UNC496MF TaxID=1502753 RepID=UPI0008E07EE6|nr:bifunctional UDP-sugar hydrolase/5'-nucleotidase [Paenibacillus sp. UNC496MF]SFI31034.1 2',3'-cyclic-nucleotide 2'-phosphodiesterase / 3'-nucleotidase [Paenibacillus sp. UNC496MF]